jgi:UrcA family protein
MLSSICLHTAATTACLQPNRVPKSQQVHYRLADLRTKAGIAALHSRIRAAVAKVCAEDSMSDWRSQTETECRNVASRSTRPQIAQAIALARRGDNLAMATPTSIALR